MRLPPSSAAGLRTGAASSKPVSLSVSASNDEDDSSSDLDVDRDDDDDDDDDDEDEDSGTATRQHAPATSSLTAATPVAAEAAAPTAVQRPAGDSSDDGLFWYKPHSARPTRRPANEPPWTDRTQAHTHTRTMHAPDGNLADQRGRRHQASAQ